MAEKTKEGCPVEVREIGQKKGGKDTGVTVYDVNPIRSFGVLWATEHVM